MKDKRMLLRVGSIIEIIYTIVMMVYYILKGKLTDEVIANLFILIIGFIVGVLLFKISLKNIDEIKKNNIIDYFKEDIQIFITTTDIKDRNDELKAKSDIYVVDNGNFNKED